MTQLKDGDRQPGNREEPHSASACAARRRRMAGTSRVNREVYARSCERLEVKILRPGSVEPQTATAPRTTVRSPFEWKAEDPGWRERYNRIRPEDRERLLALLMQGGAAWGRHRAFADMAGRMTDKDEDVPG
jgi:hypothetical protein